MRCTNSDDKPVTGEVPRPPQPTRPRGSLWCPAQCGLVGAKPRAPRLLWLVLSWRSMSSSEILGPLCVENFGPWTMEQVRTSPCGSASSCPSFSLPWFSPRPKTTVTIAIAITVPRSLRCMSLLKRRTKTIVLGPSMRGAIYQHQISALYTTSQFDSDRIERKVTCSSLFVLFDLPARRVLMIQTHPAR